jgi:outer membrane protein assembly factor BamB
VLHGDTLVINWDHEGKSFIVALDSKTGLERWRVERDEVTSWSTPIVVQYKGPPQVIVSATGKVRGYDLRTGKEIWACGGLSHNVVASPVFSEGILYVGSSYETRSMMAIQIEGAHGDISNTSHILWQRQHDTPYVPSPLLTGEQICFHRHLSGVMTCVNKKTGKTIWGPQKLPGLRRVFASPVGAAGRIYSLSREGNAVVLERSHQRKVLAQNHLDDAFTASPVIVGNELYLRGEKNLYCIASTN